MPRAVCSEPESEFGMNEIEERSDEPSSPGAECNRRNVLQIMGAAGLGLRQSGARAGLYTGARQAA